MVGLWSLSIKDGAQSRRAAGREASDKLRHNFREGAKDRATDVAPLAENGKTSERQDVRPPRNCDTTSERGERSGD